MYYAREQSQTSCESLCRLSFSSLPAAPCMQCKSVADLLVRLRLRFSVWACLLLCVNVCTFLCGRVYFPE